MSQPDHWQIKDQRSGWLLHKANTYEELDAWREQWRTTPYLGYHDAANMVIVPRYYEAPGDPVVSQLEEQP